MRTDDEIEDQLAKVSDSMDEHGSRGAWPGMSYEDGVRAALLWVTGEADEGPMDEDD